MFITEWYKMDHRIKQNEEDIETWWGKFCVFSSQSIKKMFAEFVGNSIVGDQTQIILRSVP